jgi:hypothetical protein
MVDGVAVGFLEFNKSKYQVNEIYINSDFVVSNTRYKRLSKLVVMMAICGETKKMLEKFNVLRVHTIMTTAFMEITEIVIDRLENQKKAEHNETEQ